MSDITTGKAPTRRKGASRYNDIVDAGLDNVGEWVSMELDMSHSPQNPTIAAHSGMLAAVARRFCEVSVRDGILYLRILEEPRR